MSILRQKKSIEIPENAVVKGNIVSWNDKKNRKQSGKLTKTGRDLSAKGCLPCGLYFMIAYF
ncbi:MAG: hypothetical protein LBK82_12395 [Planctomycetaceae bacterium]|jgi:hypothetical protein|nr:hypothetical protein [Planctomycetaceae bacterium]